MVKFQMVGSENPNTIAVVTAVVDIESFRKDQNWYEIVEEPVKEKPAVKTPRTATKSVKE